MNKSSLIGLSALALSVIAAPAKADTTINGKLSTLGLGLEAAFPIKQDIDVRVGLNTYNRNFNKDSSGTNYDGKLKLSNVLVTADWHPTAGAFRISGGLMYNGNKFDMTASPTSGGTITVNNINYNVPAGSNVKANVDFRSIAPYLGIGWGRTPKNRGISFTSDIGVVFQGAPRSNLSTNISSAIIPASEISKANATLQSNLHNFKIYPVISFGIGYTW